MRHYPIFQTECFATIVRSLFMKFSHILDILHLAGPLPEVLNPPNAALNLSTLAKTS